MKKKIKNNISGKYVQKSSSLIVLYFTVQNIYIIFYEEHTKFLRPL